MSNMINSKPRFAVDDVDGRVFCYLTSRYFEPVGTKALPDGTWDLALVKAGILAGSPIDGAKVSNVSATTSQVIANENKLAQAKAAKARAALAPVDKVAQANADFESTIDESTMTPFERAQAAIARRNKQPAPAPAQPGSTSGGETAFEKAKAAIAAKHAKA
jgi:hypothetical protein